MSEWIRGIDNKESVSIRAIRPVWAVMSELIGCFLYFYSLLFIFVPVRLVLVWKWIKLRRIWRYQQCLKGIGFAWAWTTASVRKKSISHINLRVSQREKFSNKQTFRFPPRLYRPMLHHLLFQCFAALSVATWSSSSVVPHGAVVLWISNRLNARLFAPAYFISRCLLLTREKNSKQTLFQATIVFVWILKAWTKNNSRNLFPQSSFKRECISLSYVNNLFCFRLEEAPRNSNHWKSICFCDL